MKRKSFDAVRCMREIRDALGREFQGMSFEEQRRHLAESRAPREGGTRKTPIRVGKSDHPESHHDP